MTDEREHEDTTVPDIHAEEETAIDRARDMTREDRRSTWESLLNRSPDHITRWKEGVS
jgi:hypothetical protein